MTRAEPRFKLQPGLVDVAKEAEIVIKHSRAVAVDIVSRYPKCNAAVMI